MVERRTLPASRGRIASDVSGGRYDSIGEKSVHSLCFYSRARAGGNVGQRAGVSGAGNRSGKHTLLVWKETLANPASRFITVDVLFLALAVIVWMLREARRLKMRGVWLYVVGGFLIAISVAYPLFMIHRERVLGASPSDDAERLGVGDKVGLAILSVMFVAYAAVALSAG